MYSKLVPSASLRVSVQLCGRVALFPFTIWRSARSVVLYIYIYGEMYIHIYQSIVRIRQWSLV